MPGNRISLDGSNKETLLKELTEALGRLRINKIWLRHPENSNRRKPLSSLKLKTRGGVTVRSPVRV